MYKIDPELHKSESSTPYCFVIQPFDGAEFDKRFEDIIKPAIEKEGLQAYRVDNDPKVNKIIDAIENGIRNANICLADISNDNPNVWFEIGFACAISKSIILICSKKHRNIIPLDIQDRFILFYDSETPTDFNVLSLKISERIKMLLKDKHYNKEKTVENFPSSGSVRSLNAIEYALLTIISEESGDAGTGFISHYTLETGAKKKYKYSSINIGIAFRDLIDDKIIEEKDIEDPNSGEIYKVIGISTHGWECIKRSRWTITRGDRSERKKIISAPDNSESIEGDIPF